MTQERRRLDDEMRQAVKEALREWLDQRYAEVGRWTVRGVVAAGCGGMVYVFLLSQGWHK